MGLIKSQIPRLKGETDFNGNCVILKKKTMDWKKHITSEQSVLLGKPTIKGTRISVEFLVKLFAAGWTEDQILENYPRLTKEDLQAVFSYIHDCIQDGLIFDLPDKSAS